MVCSLCCPEWLQYVEQVEEAAYAMNCGACNTYCTIPLVAVLLPWTCDKGCTLPLSYSHSRHRSGHLWSSETTNLSSTTCISYVPGLVCLVSPCKRYVGKKFIDLMWFYMLSKMHISYVTNIFTYVNLFEIEM